MLLPAVQLTTAFFNCTFPETFRVIITQRGSNTLFYLFILPQSKIIRLAMTRVTDFITCRLFDVLPDSVWSCCAVRIFTESGSNPDLDCRTLSIGPCGYYSAIAAHLIRNRPFRDDQRLTFARATFSQLNVGVTPRGILGVVSCLRGALRGVRPPNENTGAGKPTG